MKPFVVAVAAVLLASVAAGCSKGADHSVMSVSAVAPQAPAPRAAQGDPELGKTVFSANCAACHGAKGTEGGVGPSLRGENRRKNYEQTIAWIKNPQPPMPKLYPAPLSERNVEDVAAYVQKL